jgi:hypothetical protein
LEGLLAGKSIIATDGLKERMTTNKKQAKKSIAQKFREKNSAVHVFLNNYLSKL